MGNCNTKVAIKKKPIRVLIMGLDSVGKTTILYTLKHGEVVTTIPDIAFEKARVDYKDVTMTLWDVYAYTGGRAVSRPLCNVYYTITDALIYVVDSNDLEGLSQARDEFWQAASDDELRDVPILVLANKQDLPGAASVQEITRDLDLMKLKKNWYITGTVATQGEGLYEGMDWLTNELSSKESHDTKTTMATGGKIVSKSAKTDDVMETKRKNKILFGWHSFKSTLYKLYTQ